MTDKTELHIDPPMPGTPVKPSISEAIATFRQTSKPPAVKADDPAPGAMVVHREKLEAIVRAASATALDAGRQARDELDEVLAATTDQTEHQLERIMEFVTKTEALTNALSVIRKELGTASKQMNPNTIISPPAKNTTRARV